MVNIKLKYHFVETSCTCIIDNEFIYFIYYAIINLRCVSTKLYFNLKVSLKAGIVLRSDKICLEKLTSSYPRRKVATVDACNKSGFCLKLKKLSNLIKLTYRQTKAIA